MGSDFLLATSSVLEHLRLAHSVHGADACPLFMRNRQLAVLAADLKRDLGNGLCQQSG
jgi:hypothetical protein